MDVFELASFTSDESFSYCAASELRWFWDASRSSCVCAIVSVASLIDWVVWEITV